MKFSLPFFALAIFLFTAEPSAGKPFEVDIIPTAKGDLEITFIGHGTLMFKYDGKVIHVDPYGKLSDYRKMPKADMILITHEHGDHLDPAAISAIRKGSTIIVANPATADRIEGSRSMENWDKMIIMGIPVEAVPAYNVVHKRGTGDPFHPKGRDNGYVVAFGDKRVYIAGDTENIEDMENLGSIDIAFIPANLPYTMTPGMAADAARKINPAILYPYHYGDTDIRKIAELLGDTKDIEVRIRSMK